MSNSESDEDVPSAVSFKESKIEHENQDNQIKDFLRERRESLKDKRRSKNETLKIQKTEKLKRELSKRAVPSASEDEQKISQLQKYQHSKRFLPTRILSSLKDSLPSDSIETNRLADNSSSDDEPTPAAVRPKRLKRKVYSKFNINVESLTHLENKRGIAALDFKNKRFAKVQRESVDKNRIHEEKLIASGQKLFAK